jgi:opacity protein-like surface antigen
MTATVRAQGIERYSMAGENAATAGHTTGNQPYNLQIGPVTLRADAGSTVSYNDNINLANTGRQEDWIITPGVNIHGLWQATELNTLKFDLGIGYQEYLLHPNNSAPLILPDSQTQFNVFIGDFKITLHDAFSYQQNPVAVGQLSNVSQFSIFSNDAGIIVDWDLSGIIASLRYDHKTFLVLQQAYSYLDNQSDTVSPQVIFAFTKTIQAGFSASFGSTRYDQNVQNNSIQLSAGPFVQAQISENLAVVAQTGWQVTQYSHGGSNGDNSGISAPSVSVGINHRINDALQQSLTAGREFIPGITSNYTDRIYVNYTPSWRATSLFNIAPQLWWESLQDSNATAGGISTAPVDETSTRLGAGLAISFALTEHAKVNLSYNYVMKSSNQRSLDYYQNLVSLGLGYQF